MVHFRIHLEFVGACDRVHVSLMHLFEENGIFTKVIIFRVDLVHFSACGKVFVVFYVYCWEDIAYSLSYVVYIKISFCASGRLHFFFMHLSEKNGMQKKKAFGFVSAHAASMFCFWCISSVLKITKITYFVCTLGFVHGDLTGIPREHAALSGLAVAPLQPRGAKLFVVSQLRPSKVIVQESHFGRKWASVATK